MYQPIPGTLEHLTAGRRLPLGALLNVQRLLGVLSDELLRLLRKLLVDRLLLCLSGFARRAALALLHFGGLTQFSFTLSCDGLQSLLMRSVQLTQTLKELRF